MGVSITIQDTDMGMKQLRTDLKHANGAHTKVGLPHDGTLVSGEVKTMADLVRIGGVHEFGYDKGNIPERSFIRSTYDENIAALNMMVQKEIDLVIAGRSDTRRSLARLGEFMVPKIRRKITRRIAPALSKKSKRGRDNGVPLYDSGQLLQSITHVEVL